jgi:NAD+ diphosphatase
MPELFIPSAVAPRKITEAWWFAFAGSQLLVLDSGPAAVSVPYVNELSSIGLLPVRTQFLGYLGDQPCFSAELMPTCSLPAGTALRCLRQLYGSLEETWFAIAGLAFQVMEWDRTHQFCGACGQPTQPVLGERVRRCLSCQSSHYPRVSPAMIVLIAKGDEILLGRAPRFRPGMYSLLAGYVDPGESLEAAVVREVREEVGLEIANLRYWGSQPWPFPHTLMVGYTATYAGGKIVLDDQELTDAAWFSKDNLPLLPPPVSIARKMIDWFVAAPADSDGQNA